jgi:DNA repair photolyase
MDITQHSAKKILTPQRNGFLASGPYPFTHALSGYTGCGFGQTTCGLYCYAQFLPNWTFQGGVSTWGKAVSVKQNAAELLAQELSAMTPARRRQLRIFMSSSTDPYQPIEHKYQITRQCLEIFARYEDLDLLVVQTRSPLAMRDLPLLQRIPYACLSVTIETDAQDVLKGLKGGPALTRRWELVKNASAAGVSTQITVSPCLAYKDLEQFGQQLLTSGALRLIVDTVVDGDGTHGERTSRSLFAQAVADWDERTHALQLYHYLCEHSAEHGITIGWSNAGFCGIPSRHQTTIATPAKLDFQSTHNTT